MGQIILGWLLRPKNSFRVDRSLANTGTERRSRSANFWLSPQEYPQATPTDQGLRLPYTKRLKWDMLHCFVSTTDFQGLPLKWLRMVKPSYCKRMRSSLGPVDKHTPVWCRGATPDYHTRQPISQDTNACLSRTVADLATTLGLQSWLHWLFE